MNTQNSLIEAIKDLSGCTIKQAKKVYHFYCLEGIIKLRNSGGYDISHGIFMDKNIILDAIRKMVKYHDLYNRKNNS